jgi:hypothetical protein
MSKCAAGTFALPQKGCVPIDGPAGCGTGTWGNIPDDPMNVYVDPSYAGNDGDGSMAKPVTTIAAALSRVQPGGRVALAAGTYMEQVSVETPVEIAGRCPSMVTIVGTGLDTTYPVVVWVDAGPSTIRGVTITGPGVGIEADRDVTVDTVHLTGTAGSALLSGGHTMTITNTLAEGTAPDPTSQHGNGLSAEMGATVTVTDSAFYQNRAQAVLSYGPGVSVTMTDVLVDTTLPEMNDQLHGEGVTAINGGTVDMTAVAIVNSTVSGFAAEGIGSTASANGVLVERTQPQATDMTQGQGVVIAAGGDLTLASSAVLGNEEVGVFVYGGNTHAIVTGSLIAGTAPQASDGKYGAGVEVQGGASVTTSDNVLSKNHQTAIGVHEKDTHVTMIRDILEDTIPQVADGQYGCGAIVGTGVLDLASVTIARSHVAAILVSDGSAVLDGSLLLDTQAGNLTLQGSMQTLTDVGDGLVANGGAFVTVKNTRVEGCVRAGLVYSSSQGSISQVSSTKNQFGLVLDGMPTPTLDKASVFTGNMQPQSNDANLPVPSAPADVPP